MKTLMIVAALALPATALAEAAAPAREEAGFRARLYERYCAKLREGPEAYVQFVRRLRMVHGYTYSDFAPAQPGAPVVVDCRASPAQVAAVNQSLARAAR